MVNRVLVAGITLGALAIISPVEAVVPSTAPTIPADTAIAGGDAPRQVTIDDAFAVKDLGTISVNSVRSLLAVEAGADVVIMDSANGRELKRIAGRAPQWSPDGRMLAFFSRKSGHTQLHFWTLATGTEVQATHLPNGIVPNIRTMAGACSPQKITWSPDGRSIAFVSIALSFEGIPAVDPAVPAVRVFKSHPDDPRTSLEAIYKNRAAMAGVLAAPDDWQVWYAADPDFVAAMNYAGQVPEKVANRIMVLDIPSGALRSLPGNATQHFCPAWSPDGRTIASIADVAEPTVSNDSYGALGSPDVSTVALHDVRTGHERLLPAEALGRIRSVIWAGNNRLLTIAESGKKQFSFPRLMAVEVVSGRRQAIDTPGGHAVLELRDGRDGRIGVKLSERFTDTLWSFEPRPGRFTQMQTFDWHVTNFDFLSARQVIFSAESAQFSGRLVVSAADKAPRVIHDVNPQLAHLRLGEQRRFTWKNRSGEEVDGIVILPPGYRSDKRYPVVVDAYPRAPRDRFLLRPAVEDTGQLLAADGFVIFRPAIRAPHGAYWFTRDEAYQMKAVGVPGIKLMVDDFESGIEALVAEGIADPKRIGIYGFSNGGWVANMLVTQTHLLAAAAVQSGLSNAIDMALGLAVKKTRGVDAATGGNVFDNTNDYIQLSPIFRMREVKTPMLLLVGDYDSLWVSQMIAQYEVLRAEGRDATLVRYPGEGHVRSKRETVIDAHKRVTAFFRQYLGEGM